VTAAKVHHASTLRALGVAADDEETHPPT
jgi:hypothetical protein